MDQQKDTTNFNDRDLLVRIDTQVSLLRTILNDHLHEHFKIRLATYVFLGSLIAGLIVVILKIR